MPKLRDLTGQKFGRLFVIKRFGKDNSGHATWLCLCDCGNKTIVPGSSLTCSNTKSCGCIHTEILLSNSITHNLSKTKLHKVWREMKNRCKNPKCRNYKDYGGKGVSVCKEWKDDFMNFYIWSINNGYNVGTKRGEYTIDRINVNGNYEPNNCRWINNKTNCRNKTNCHYITLCGETHPISEWLEILNISKYEFQKRLKAGLKDEEFINSANLVKKRR